MNKTCTLSSRTVESNKAKETTGKKVTDDMKEMEEDDLGVGFVPGQGEITP